MYVNARMHMQSERGGGGEGRILTVLETVTGLK